MNKTTSQIISGALFDFLGFLTTRDKPTAFGSCELATPAVDLLKEWADKCGLSIDDPDVQGWRAALASPAAQEQPVAQVPDEVERMIDDAVGLVELPPIRVGQALAEAIQAGAARSGHVVQAEVRSALARAFATPSQPVAADAPAEVAKVWPATLDFTLEEESVKFLGEMIAAGDEPVSLRFMVGDGHGGFGLYVCETEYPEEGASFVQALPRLAAPVEVKGADSALAKNLRRLADIGKDCGRLVSKDGSAWVDMHAAADALAGRPAPAAEAVYQLRAPLSQDWIDTPKPEYMQAETHGKWYEVSEEVYANFSTDPSYKARTLYTRPAAPLSEVKTDKAPDHVRLTALLDEVRSIRNHLPHGAHRSTMNAAIDRLDVVASKLANGDNVPAKEIQPTGEATDAGRIGERVKHTWVISLLARSNMTEDAAERLVSSLYDAATAAQKGGEA